MEARSKTIDDAIVELIESTGIKIDHDKLQGKKYKRKYANDILKRLNSNGYEIIQEIHPQHTHKEKIHTEHIIVKLYKDKQLIITKPIKIELKIIGGERGKK
jgi:hypothetical protein